MLNKCRNTINKYNMLEKGDKVIVGLSGGADSCALLQVLCALKDEFKLSLTAVHINHCLRGDEADEDEAFAEKLCHRLGVEFLSEGHNVAEFAKEKGIGTEEAGRIIRYAVFERIRIEKDAEKIAVAHNLNDRAETVIMRLARGSGVKGLTGISPVRGNIIRPLIGCERSEIEKYCRDNNIDFRTDSTNCEDIYTRNRVRHKILPLIVSEINENALINIAKTAEMAAEDNDFIELEAEKAFDFCKINTFEKNNVYFDANKLKKFHQAIIKRVILKALVFVSGANKDIYSKNVEDVLSLIYKGTGKSVDLPYGMKAEMVYDRLTIGKDKEISKKELFYELQIGSKLHIEEAGRYILVETEEKFDLIVPNLYTKSFNYAKIRDKLTLRTRKAGDFIRLFPDGGRKKLKDFFIDKKIPRSERDKIWFIASGNEVLWIPDLWYSKFHEADVISENVLHIYIWEDA